MIQFWQQGDVITRGVAALLMLMSVVAWVLIFWKGWLLRRAQQDVARAIPAFWSATSIDAGLARLAALDREALLQPLVAAALTQTALDTLEARGPHEAQVTRRLRDALHRIWAQLRFGQIVFASIGSTSPFIGLFGTVWGIYHALLSIAVAGTITMDKVSGPIGESLIMTAAGLAVAIPGVLAYNVFGQMIRGCEAELEGFAHDLHKMVSHTPVTSQTASENLA